MSRLRAKHAFETQTKLTDNMIPLEELDNADMRHDRCPNCKFYPLDRVDGFKLCSRCNSTYKTYDGQGYLIAKRLRGRG